MRVLSRSLFVALLTVSACVPEEPPIDLGSDPQDLSLADAGMPMDATPDVALVDAAVDALPPVDAASVCPSFETGVSVGKTPMGDIKEASGIVASRRSPGTLWVHNDSGASATLYALTSTGAMQAIYSLDGASAQDCLCSKVLRERPRRVVRFAALSRDAKRLNRESLSLRAVGSWQTRLLGFDLCQ